MALIVSDRVKETTSTTGTGTYTLAGALPSYASFADIGNGNTTYYACTDGTDWEVGIGTYTASGTTLARTTILQSSNSDAAVNWGSGIKTIFCTLPAEKYIFKDADGHVSIADDLYVSNKIIHIGDTDTYMNFPADETWQVVTQNSSAIKATELQITLGRNVISTYNATFTGNVNAAQFRAQADTSYYLDPDGDSVLSNIQLYNNDAGASAGPTFELYRDSASPASSDQLGEIIFSGKDSSGNKNNNIRIYQDYVQILSSQRIPSLIIGATAEIAGLQQSELNVLEANRGSVSLMGDVLVVGGASATIKENFTAEKNLTVDGFIKTDTILSATDPSTIGIGLTATGGSTLHDLTLTGNLTITGTVDGRDVSVDGAKLDLIEAGATADQTKADIDALGINADQVDGLEASQFLRSDANDTGTKLTLETLNLTSDNTSSKHLTLTNDTGPNLTVQVYGSGSSTLTIENASTSTDLLSLTDAGNLTVAGTVEGRNLVNDGAKLDLIEAGATADQTKADIDALGIDADQLDGQEGTYYLDYNNFTNTPTIPTVPTNVSAFTNDAGYITSADGGNADQLDGQEGTYYLDYNNFTNTPTIPTNNNQLTNGAGYITNTLTSTDAGATAGPTFELYRNSASPAAADLMGEIRFEGEDYDGTKVLNGWIYSRYSTLGSAFRIPEVIIEAGYRAGSTTATPEVFKGSAGGVSLFDGKLTVESGGVTIPDDLTVETNASVDGLFQTDLILGSTDVTKGIGLTSTGSSSLHNLSLSGTLTSSISAGSTALDLATNDGYAQMRVIRNATTNTTNDDGMFIGYGNSSSGVTRIYGGGATSGGIVVSGSGVNDVTIAGSTAWHAGNDGSGSGLDADLLDGVQGSSYLRSDANDTATGNVTFSGVIYNDVIVGNTDNTKSVVLTAAGTTNLHDLDLDGNLTIAGTVDGRDVSVDGAKLDGIEAGATADQTASEILTAIKTVDGSGSGLDADLLDGVQGSSYLRSDTSDTFTTLSGTQLNLGGMVSLQESTDRGDLLQITSNTSTWGGLQIRNSSNEGRWSFMTDGSTAGIYDDENGDWHIQWSENAGAIFYHNGLQSLQLVDSTGIRVGSNTSSNIYMQDTDGTERRIHCNSGQVGFLDSSNNWSAFSSNAGDWYSMVSSRAPIFYDNNNTGYYADPASTSRFNAIDFGTSGYYIHAGNWGMRNTTPDGYIEFGPANTSHAHIYTDRPNFYFNKELIVNGNTVWNSGNDGSGSGLDADLLDGLQASQFLRSDTSDTMSGDLTVNNLRALGNSNAVDLGNGGGEVDINYRGQYSTWQVGVNQNYGNGSWFWYRDGSGYRGGIDTSANMFAEGSMRAPIFYDKNNTSYFADLTSAGLSVVANGTYYTDGGSFINDGGSLRVTSPGGASYTTTTSTVTGAIKITLPVSWTDTMMRMTIQVYEYSTNESFTVYCGGYNYGGGASWYNTFASIIGSPRAARNFNVRFGHDGTYCCIYIGETNNTWSYPQVTVTDFQAGYNNFGWNNWDAGWNISFATSFGTITATQSNCEVGRFHYTDMRAPIFRDLDNTGYYADPASTSILKKIQFDTSNVAAPTPTDATTGARIILYPTGGGASYSIGIESSTMWFNSDDHYKWYSDGALSFEYNNTDNVFRLYDNSADASLGPTLELYRDSASPAASDLMGEIRFEGRDYDGTKVMNGRIYSRYSTIASSSRVPELVITAGYRVGTVESSGELLKGSAGGVSLDGGAITTSSSSVTITRDATAEGNLTVDGLLLTDGVIATNLARNLNLTTTGYSRLEDVRPTYLTRADHSTGHLVGSYNSVGANSSYSNPIYTIGSSYNPSNSDLVSMYGIGYSHPNANFDGISNVLAGWGLYVAANGVARVGLDADNGRVYATGAMYAPIYYDKDNTGYYADPASTSNFLKIKTGDNYTSATPRWDTSFYVIQGQHWYGDSSSQVMYLGESGNPVRLRGSLNIGSDANAASGYSLSMRGSINMHNNNIHYVNELHFNDDVRFYDDGNNQYLNFKYGSTGAGGIKVYDGGGAFQGYFYTSGSGSIGILPPDGSWGIQITNTESSIYHALYTPIVYDQNSTGYYLDPASTSSLGQVNLVNANVLVNYVNGTGNSIYNSIAGSGSSNLYWKHGTSGANLMYLDSSGNLTAIGNVTAYSDIKLKDDIQVIDNAIDKVKQIRGVTFTRNDMHDDKRQTGVIAQEVEQVLPEVVTESDYDGIKSVAYGNMVGLLIEAIKEQQKQIEALQEQINGLTK